jgi:SAM-dependent methyltransferase
MSVDFDEYRDSYREEVQRSIGFIGQDVDVFARAKADYLVRLAERQVGPPDAVQALDVGCGIGLTDGFLASRLRSLHGVDVSERVIDQAARANPSVNYRAYAGHALPYPDGSFDLVFAICVLHHLPRRSWTSIVKEMRRVTRRGGAVAVLEHNPLNPLTRLAVHRCQFDQDIELLRRRTVERLLVETELKLADSRYIVFFPWRTPLLEHAEALLAQLPLGAQHAVAGVRS